MRPYPPLRAPRVRRRRTEGDRPRPAAQPRPPRVGCQGPPGPHSAPAAPAPGAAQRGGGSPLHAGDSAAFLTLPMQERRSPPATTDKRNGRRQPLGKEGVLVGPLSRNSAKSKDNERSQWRKQARAPPCGRADKSYACHSLLVVCISRAHVCTYVGTCACVYTNVPDTTDTNVSV